MMHYKRMPSRKVLMTETDGNFNKIDSKLRQIEEYIHQLEAENERLRGYKSAEEMRLDFIESPDLLPDSSDIENL